MQHVCKRSGYLAVDFEFEIRLDNLSRRSLANCDEVITRFPSSAFHSLVMSHAAYRIRPDSYLITESSSVSSRLVLSSTSRPRTRRHDARRPQAPQALLKDKQNNSEYSTGSWSKAIWLGVSVSLALVRQLACEEGRRTSSQRIVKLF